LKYLIPPSIWVLIGTGVALTSQSLYILWSGNDPEQFASSFSSALLWYRLLPNATYSVGVLSGSILVTLPVFLVLVFRFQNTVNKPHIIRLLGICSIFAVLLVGGLVVSVKIGGGSNLHNIDASLAILLVVAVYFYFGKVATNLDNRCKTIPNAVNLVLVLIPVLMTLSTSTHFIRYSEQVNADAIIKMQKNINRALEDGGEILFISERQLLTFNYIQGVELVPEYEKVFLMEMVMAGNENYLNAFQQDIQTQRFDLIITDPLFDRYKEPGEDWAEENNVWVEAVSVPVLCHYWRKVTFQESGVQILAPRENPIDCQFALDSRGEE
jgi:hypothetical protein